MSDWVHPAGWKRCLLAVSLFVSGTSCASVVPSPPPDGGRGSGNNAVAETVRAKRFVIVDSENHEVGFVGQSDTGSNELYLDGGPMGCAISLGARKGGVAWIHIYDNRGDRRAVSMTWTAGLGPDVTLYDGNEIPRLSLVVLEREVGEGNERAWDVKVRVYDENGQLKAELAQ